MLHRALREGPDRVEGLREGNAKAQLRGKIDWVAQSNPARGEKLRGLFAQVRWAP
jgi:hypothetical protein